MTNFLGENWLDITGTFVTDAMHVVERYTIVDADTITYEATIEDPKVFTRPWKLAGYFTRAAKDFEIFEYACHEGNRYLDLLGLAGSKK